MKTTLLTLTICSILLLSPAMASPAGPLDEDAIRARIAASPGLKNADEVDAIVLFEGDYFDYENGRAVWRHQELIRLYSEYAIDHLGDPRVAWDAGRQMLDIHANRTYLNDGSAQDAPDNAHNEVTPFGLDRAVDFLDIREMVITRVGLERGVTVWLDYTILDVDPGWLPYGRHLFFHDEFPILERELFVRGLPGSTVNPEQAVYSLPDPVETGGGLLWNAKELPARPRDLNRRTGDQLGWAAVYAVQDWKVLGVELANACKASFADLGSLGKELEKLEEEHHPLGTDARLSMWMDWIDSRVVRVRHGLLPWARGPRTVARILDSGTATDLERTALLLACCRSAEMPIEVYFPARWRSLAEGPCVPGALASPGVFIKSRKGKPLAVDSAAWRIDPRPEPRLLVSLGDTPASRWHKLWKVDDRIAMKVFWNLETGEAAADLSLFGPAAQRLGLAQPQDLLSDWAGGWSEGAEAAGVVIRNMTPAILEGSVELAAPMPETDEDGFLILPLPMPPLGPGDFSPSGLANADRDAAWLPENMLSVAIEWELILPESWDVRLPVPGEYPFANGTYSISSQKDEERATLSYRLDWSEDAVSTEQWPELRAALLVASEARTTRVILSKTGE